jgi:serine/threonine protein kinase/Tfp pilus assembly protein PilF
MATVYLAEDLKHRRQVAIKLLGPDLATAVGAERFLREIETAASLTHPHILPVHDSGEADGLLYYVMPYVEGESLRDRLEREKPLPIHEAVQIAREVAGALDFAHQRGVIHRDVKPENILLAAGEAVLADFGIAKAAADAGEERLTKTGVSLGTPAYASPEQAAGERDLDGRSDLYSLGCVLYEMLAGETPFDGPTPRSVMQKHLAVEAPPVAVLRPGVSAPLSRAVSRSLAKNRADRFGSVREFEGALRNARQEEDTAPGDDGRRRHPLLVSFLIGLSVVAVSSLTILVTRVGDRPTPEPISGWEAPGPPGVVAVLPLVNLSAEPGNEYFASGVHEDILTHLSRMSGLTVISRTSVQRYADTDLSLREVAAELGAGSILEGSVQRDGDRVRVATQLIDAASDAHLWADTYDRILEDIFEVQTEIAREVASALEAALTPEEEGRIAQVPTRSLRAYELYLQARQFDAADLQSVEGIYAQEELLENALSLDPRYARAWAALAENYAVRPTSYGLQEFWGDSALAAARRAIELDPELAEGYAALGLVYQERFLYAEALENYRQAVRLDPNLAVAYREIGRMQASLGRFDEALRSYRSGLRRDPHVEFLYSNIAHIYAALGDLPTAERWFREQIARSAPGSEDAAFVEAWIHWWAGRPDRSVELIRRAIPLVSREPIPRMGLAELALAAGDNELAAEQAEEAMRLSPDPGNLAFNYLGTTILGIALERLGDHEAARAHLENSLSKRRTVIERGGQDPLTSMELALVREALGDREEAVRWVERAYEAGFRNVHRMEVGSIYDGLRQDPHIERLMGLMRSDVERMREALFREEEAAGLRPAGQVSRGAVSARRVGEGNQIG